VKYGGCGCDARMVTERPTRTPLRGFSDCFVESSSLPESIDVNLPPRPATTSAGGSIGCVFATDQACIAAIQNLQALGIGASEIHVGAASAERAASIAGLTGVLADILPDDPLHGMPGYSGGDAARRAVDRAGVWGAGIGALAGFLIGRGPFGNVMPVPVAAQPFAAALLFFVIGLFIGSILGAALAPQQSSHAAFRLIDGMHDGGLALIVDLLSGRKDEANKALEAAGASGLTQL
jgi:hypothetical protein